MEFWYLMKSLVQRIVDVCFFPGFMPAGRQFHKIPAMIPVIASPLYVAKLLKALDCRSQGLLSDQAAP